MSNEYHLCSRTVQRKLCGAVCFLTDLWTAPVGKHAMTRLRKMVHLLVLLLALSAGPMRASDLRVTPDMVSDALQAQGYTVQSVTRTLLGRARIVAQQGQIWREVVLDLSTGQILRDYAVEFSPNDLPDRQTEAMPRGGRVLDADDLPMLEN
jgi:hypothetical protein